MSTLHFPNSRRFLFFFLEMTAGLVGWAFFFLHGKKETLCSWLDPEIELREKERQVFPLPPPPQRISQTVWSRKKSLQFESLRNHFLFCHHVAIILPHRSTESAFKEGVQNLFKTWLMSKFDAAKEKKKWNKSESKVRDKVSLVYVGVGGEVKGERES